MIHQNSDICYWQSLIVSKVVVPLVLGVLSTLLTALLLEVLIAVSWVIAPQLPQLPFLLEPLLNDLKTILIKGVSLVVSVWEHPVFLLFFSLYVCRYVGATGVIIGLYCFGIAGLESDTQLILVLIIISGYDVTLWVHYLH